MIDLEHLSKRYSDDGFAVEDLSLRVADGELAVLVGPSGCGKTTTLRMINRLIEPTGGRIVLDGDDVTHVDPVKLRRRIGYVIQQGGLFPHERVAENVATVPKLLGWDKARIAKRVDELLELVGLDPGRFARRFPHELSGGQRQRVGVARALAADPPVLLMDEPFAAVDPLARDRLQQEFLNLQRQLKKTVVFVTHDIDEAVRLGDRIAILRQGGILEQYDTPAELLGHPATEFVADFVGSDRGLRRLAVTGIDRADLSSPPVVGPTTDSAVAAASIEADGSQWAVVVDGDGRLMGWVGLDQVRRAPTVVGAVRRLEAQVPLQATLKTAFAEMLQHDAGWVAVHDGGRYLGVLTPDDLHAAMRRSVGGQPVEV